MLKIIKIETLNKYFISWVYLFMLEKIKNLTILLDRKIIYSTNKIEKTDNPLYIIIIQISEFELMLVQRATNDKSNEFIKI